MRLLNIETLSFKEFFDSAIPSYYILSHRWTDEVTYKDFVKKRNSSSAGHRKIIEFCDFVKRTKIDRTTKWVWIDTCCIDKRSSAELSEAINSMFSWYQRAERCIVYLSDIGTTSKKPLWESVWFSRGWTLQELIAPKYGVIFCDRKWRIIGHTCVNACNGRSCRSRFQSCETGRIAEVTKIGLQNLVAFNPRSQNACVAQCMAWASRRLTTRKEDEAYCLLGIFDVNMPLIYGEGSKAFFRLQKEIIQKSLDQSIFAWWLPPDMEALGIGGSIFASSPKWFEQSANVRWQPNWGGDLGGSSVPTQPFTITNKGLELKTHIREVDADVAGAAPAIGGGIRTVLLQLNCELSHVPVQLHLRRSEQIRRPDNSYFHRINQSNVHPSKWLPKSLRKSSQLETIYVETAGARLME